MAGAPAPGAATAGIVPAQLGFLAIFNPSLGNTDETVDDQIVYYTSIGAQTKRGHRSRRSKAIPEEVSQEERNERLRQIGLAQGMVEFSRSFSDGSPLDTIETEQSRVVLHELEPGWWILASIDLTKLPTQTGTTSSSAGSKDTQNSEPAIEYSSREVKPVALLLQDLLRAHSLFLLHHDSSLSSLFVRIQRPKFTRAITRYWNLFLSTWTVLLHGSPVRNVFGGIKVAACGELGVGVGEEDRGSGERDVLESLVDRIEGLVDLVVCKFGSYDPDNAPGGDPTREEEKWLGLGHEPGGEDGAIFTGIGALSKNSLRDITCWTEDLYTWGEDAYGVKENPLSNHTRRTRRRRPPTSTDPPPQQAEEFMKLPPPVTELAKRTRQASPTQDRKSASSPPPQASEAEGSSVDKVMSYLKLGYGTHWSLGGTASPESEDAPPPKPDPAHPTSDAQGHFLIGLKGDVEDSDTDPTSRFADTLDEAPSRTLLRTLTVELESEYPRSESQTVRIFGSHDHELSQRPNSHPTTPFDSQDRNKARKLRVVVYANRPFLFVLLFQLHTDSLTFDPLYRSLHHQLAPLRRPLVASTAYRPERPDVGAAANIYDLVWDPRALTIHSTIPNIPDPAAALTTSKPGNASVAPVPDAVWTRAEALSTHSMILTLFAATRSDPGELERTCKTGRGWWVVWRRIVERAPPSPPTSNPDSSDEQVASEAQRPPPMLRHISSEETADSDGALYPSSRGSESRGRREGSDEERGRDGMRGVSKEIFLIRKAGDHGERRGPMLAAREGGGWADGASRLAQGIGVDTVRYIEGLLSLNR